MAAPTTSSVAQVPGFSLAILCGVLAEMTAEYPDHAARLQRAANIVVLHSIERGPCSQAWFVESESQPGMAYSVWFHGYLPNLNHTSCTCPDYAKRGGPCKHALAVAIFRRCERRQADATDPTREPIPYELTEQGRAATTASVA